MRSPFTGEFPQKYQTDFSNIDFDVIISQFLLFLKMFKNTFLIASTH